MRLGVIRNRPAQAFPLMGEKPEGRKCMGPNKDARLVCILASTGAVAKAIALTILKGARG